ncbi:ATP-binding cassette domain-containing protein [Microbacterium lushaniae]|nr:ATP-binding cassette domain-containing protein [Microbacterium lushaniae]KAA9150594.1 ATP-binding cassette domain-containing protein [Microbacterium lushaniae]
MSGTFALDRVVSGYKGTDILEDVSLRLEPGTCLAVLGPNGAGKSTLLRTMSGQLPVRAGRRMLGEADTSALRVHQMARQGVRWVGEPRPLSLSLTVEDNLHVGGYLRRRAFPRLSDRVWELMPALRDKRADKAGSLSGGQQQMLAIGQALMSEPAFLLLDEPSIGLAAHVVQQLAELIGQLRDQGMGIAWAEQFPDIAIARSDAVLVLGAGRVRLHATPDAVDRARLEEAYIGLPVRGDGA